MTYTHNKKRVQGAKLAIGYADVKSLGKYEQSYKITASAVEYIFYILDYHK